jgi:predicted metal-dependent hydrolase
MIEISRIERSRRKTVALVITHDATLVVRAPFHASLSFIEGLVNRKSRWIRRKLDEVIRKPGFSPKKFVNGEEFLFLGGNYKLLIVENAPYKIRLADNLCLAENALPRAREVLTAWYKAEALKIIGARCAWYTGITGYKPAGVKISNAKRRWGSCSPKKMLNFSWRLAMAPPEIIDYLVVHELVHIGQPNHSKLFWNEVASILPDYKIREKWLRDNGSLLTL